MPLSEYQGYSNTDFARSVQTTLAKHFGDVELAMLRDYKMGALLQSAGRIKLNQSGRGYEWDVQYKLHQLEGNTGETTRNFVRTNLWKKAYLEYRGYQATDAIYYKETRENRGREAQIKVFDGMVGRLEESVKQGLAAQYWIDGNATGNEQSWHGIESFLGTNGTVTKATGVQRSANAEDYVAYPSDTYAGLSTVLGAYDGDQHAGAVWPHGQADPQFDFFTPLIVNYNSTSFSPQTHTFAAQGDEAMRFAIIHSQRNKTDSEVTHVMLDRSLYYQFLNLIDDKERIVVQRGGPLDLVSLGFNNVVNFDGVQVTWEASLPANVGYGLNIRNLELLCMDDKLLRAEGPEYDMETQSFRAVVSTLSNLKFKSPRNFFKLAALT